MKDSHPGIATSSQTVGPFFHFALATNDALGRIAAAGTPGERIRLRVRVLDGGGNPVPDALIEMYQADAAGIYASATAAQVVAGAFTGFGRLPTDGDGVCTFETVKPGAIRTGGRVQAPHANVCLLARGLLRQVYTRIYFAGDAEQEADPVLRLVPAGRAETLMARPLRNEEETPDSRASVPEAHASAWEFTVRLQGHDETVFFDL